MTESAATLNQRHGLAGAATVVDGQRGLPCVRVTTPAASGEIYLHGGTVTSWVPAGRSEVLFVSEASRWETGRGIRGGIPVCFPWFASRAGDPRAPSHGFVRTRSWVLDSITRTDAGIVVTLATTSDAQTRVWWPFDFGLVLQATFGDALSVELTATNTGDAPLSFEEALHTYYAVGDVTTIRVSGLGGVRHQDKVDNGRERIEEGDMTIDAETDRVYDDTASDVDIHDPSMRRRIHLSKSGSRSTVVWNPWMERARALADLHDDEWRRMVCVETANVSPSVVALDPGERHTIAMHVTVSDD
jgi:glucose-6-phosphate 1-epimerase